MKNECKCKSTCGTVLPPGAGPWGLGSTSRTRLMDSWASSAPRTDPAIGGGAMGIHPDPNPNLQHPLFHVKIAPAQGPPRTRSWRRFCALRVSAARDCFDPCETVKGRVPRQQQTPRLLCSWKPRERTLFSPACCDEILLYSSEHSSFDSRAT